MCRSVAGLAGVPGSGEVAHRAPVAFFSPSCAAPAGAASGLRAGLRIRAVIALLASTALFARLARLLSGPGARWGAAAFAVAAAGDVWIGRISFALGVTCALAAVLALVRLRPLLASGLAALCAAASPVAGLLLALAGATYWLSRQRWLRPGGVDAETGASPRPSAASGLL